MPDRYIERKGIIFDKIAEKGDTDQVAKLQKENRQLTEKVEALEVADSTLRGEYKKVRKALEFIMPVVKSLDTEDLRRKVFERRGQEFTASTEPTSR